MTTAITNLKPSPTKLAVEYIIDHEIMDASREITVEDGLMASHLSYRDSDSDQPHLTISRCGIVNDRLTGEPYLHFDWATEYDFGSVREAVNQ